MPSTGIITGHILALFESDTLIAYSINDEYEISQEIKKLAHKSQNAGQTSSGFPEGISGIKEFKGSNESFYAEDNAQVATIRNSIINGTTLTLKITTGVTGDSEVSCSVLVKNMKVVAKEGDEVKMTITYEGVGTPTIGTVS